MARKKVTESNVPVFERDLEGFKVKLQIAGYEAPEKHEYCDVWCDCSFSFHFGEIFNYNKEHDELLMPEEVDWLIDDFTKLLEERITEEKMIAPIEPDFVFLLYPKKELRKNQGDFYVSPVCDDPDVFVKWRIYFWDDGLTENYMTLVLDREDIQALRDFLITSRNADD